MEMERVGGDDTNTISVDEQLEMVRRLGLTVDEVRNDPYKLRKAGLEFLGGFNSSDDRIQETGDFNINELMNFRKNVKALLKSLTG